ncbi:MAG: hypothetical protein BWY15_02197 [Firmicutes bacterium ADurb.Bin193]|nr:MAG: hypothetical protein BWY15_02197 [Firmicutes bacterium ADurb.Bin193]
MIYVVDTNVFSRSLNNLSLDVFGEDIYVPWSDGMNNGQIISVDEVYNELDNHWGASVAKNKRTKEGAWLHDHKSAFKNLTNEECKIVADIFKSKKFREGVKEKSLRNGTPEADAFLVAKAKIVSGIIVTDESNTKPNAEKIPNICVAFEVPYITKDDFYRVLKNISKGQAELDSVTVYRKLKCKENTA